MTDAEAEEAILQRWLDTWTTLTGGTNDAPTVPFQLPNENFTATDGPWCRVAVLPTVRTQSTQGRAGTRRFTNRGRIMVQLFGPINAGMRALNLLVAHVRTVFEARRIGNDITTEAASSPREAEDGSWAQLTVSIPYDYDEQR